MERYIKLLQLLRDIKRSYGIRYNIDCRISDLYIKYEKYDQLCDMIKSEIIYINDDRIGSHTPPYCAIEKLMSPLVYGYSYNKDKDQYDYL